MTDDSAEAAEGGASGNGAPGFNPVVPKVGEVPSGGGGALIRGTVVGVVASVPGGSVPPAVLQFEESNNFSYRKRDRI